MGLYLLEITISINRIFVQEDSDVTQLRESHIEQHVALRSKTVSHGTIRREVGTLSAAFNHA